MFEITIINKGNIIVVTIARPVLVVVSLFLIVLIKLLIILFLFVIVLQCKYIKLI